MTASADDADIDGARLAARRGVAGFGHHRWIGLWSVVVVLPAIEAEFDVDRGTASVSYMVNMLGFASGGLIMGRLADRFEVRVPVTLGALMLALGYGAAALATSFGQFIAAQAVLIGLLGSSATFGPLVADVSLWFQRRRGIAVAIVASGNYLAGTLWPPVLQVVVDNFGWREAHGLVAVFCLVTMIPLTLFLRRPSPVVEGAAVGMSALTLTAARRRALMAMLVVAGLACCVAMSMPQVHIVAYCVDLGFGAARGAEMLSVMLGFGIVSRLASGWIADRIGGVGTLLLGSCLQCLALALYLPFDGWCRYMWCRPCSAFRRAGSCPATPWWCASFSPPARPVPRSAWC